MPAAPAAARNLAAQATDALGDIVIARSVNRYDIVMPGGAVIATLTRNEVIEAIAEALVLAADVVANPEIYTPETRAAHGVA